MLAPHAVQKPEVHSRTWYYADINLPCVCVWGGATTAHRQTMYSYQQHKSLPTSHKHEQFIKMPKTKWSIQKVCSPSGGGVGIWPKQTSPIKIAIFPIWKANRGWQNWPKLSERTFWMSPKDEYVGIHTHTKHQWVGVMMVCWTHFWYSPFL